MPYLLHALQDFGYFNKSSTPVKRLQQPLNFNSFMTKGEYERQLARVYKQLQVGCDSLVLVTSHITPHINDVTSYIQ
jgi:hypothetical protein